MEPEKEAARAAGVRVALRDSLRRLPFTVALLLTILLVGILADAFGAPAVQAAWFPHVGFGASSLTGGRWWAVVSSAFVLGAPLAYLIALPPALVAIGWGEWRFGSLRAAGLFFAGQVVGCLAAAGIILALQPTEWSWAQHLAAEITSGPFSGALAVLVLTIATLRAPWRLRARLALVVTITILFLYLGRLADLQNVIVVLAALAITGVLPAFRHPAGRPSEREWRLVGFVWLIALGVLELIDLAIAYDGPLGSHDPGPASLLDVATDVIVIGLVADGIRRGYRFAWMVVQILGWLNVALSALVLGVLPLAAEFGLFDLGGSVLGRTIVPSLLWLALLLFLIAGRGAFRVPLKRSRRILRRSALTRAETVRRMQAIGGGTISWMATWSGNRQIPAGEGAIAYQVHNGVAIMLGDPIVPAEEIGAAVERFAAETQQVGLVPCVFSASAAAADARPEGWRSVVVAVDTIVDLPDLAFRGKAWNDVRTALNRASREGIGYRVVRLADEPWRIQAQVRAISEQWTGDKGLPEMRFTLGTVDEAMAPEVRVGIAIDEDGNLHGVTSWLPVYSAGGRVRGWTLDLMRRRDDGFPTVMEFLIASCARQFADEGYEFISLSGAPLVRPEGGQDGPVEQVLDQVAASIEPLYGFASLHRFKQKFSPRAEPLYLLYRDEGDLPRIGLAMASAYLPDATLRDFKRSETLTKAQK